MKKLALYKCFNPRTHTGCDRRGKVQAVLQRAVSIHAPTWGATIRVIPDTTKIHSFNPRTHTGCDNAYEYFGYFL